MEERLRVGFVSIEDAMSESSWSGTPLNMLRALRNSPGVDVEVISPLRRTCRWLYLPLKLWFGLRKKEFEWRREELSLRYFASQIERVVHSRKLDVVFSTSSIPIARLAASVPAVFWTDANFHAMDGYYMKNLSSRTQAAGRRQEEAALRRADYACYASHWAADGARKLADPERVKVLPFGPNLVVEHTRQDVEMWIRERRQARPQSCTLLFVGRNWVRKGGELAVETARKMNEAGIATTLRLAGCNPPGPLPPFVEVLGHISKREPEGYKRLLDLYRTSDILILPSRAEPFGIVVAEAAAFGVPALVAASGGLAETVQEGKSGFRLPVDSSADLWAQRAKMILAAYPAFADSARSEFENRLNWSASARSLVGLLRLAAHDRSRTMKIA